MEKHCTKWALTDPFRDTCSVAFCLRATAELGEEGIVSSELLAMALPCQSCCYSCCCWQLCLWQLLPSPTVCPHSQPILQPSQKKLQNQALWPSTGSDPCSSASPDPRTSNWSLLGHRKLASVSWIRLFLWLNSSNFETVLTFSKHLLRLRSQKEWKNPKMQGLAFGASCKLNSIWILKSQSLRAKQEFHLLKKKRILLASCIPLWYGED